MDSGNSRDGRDPSRQAKSTPHRYGGGYHMPSSSPDYSSIPPHMGYPPFATPYPAAMMYPPAGMWGAMPPGTMYPSKPSPPTAAPPNTNKQAPRPSRPMPNTTMQGAPPHAMPPPYAPYYPAAMHPGYMMGYAGAPAMPRPRGPPPTSRPRGKGPPSTPPPRGGGVHTRTHNATTLRASPSAGSSRGLSDGGASPHHPHPASEPTSGRGSAASAPPIRAVHDSRVGQDRDALPGAADEALGSREELLKEVLTLRATVERLTADKAALQEQVVLLMAGRADHPPTPLPCSDSSAASAETVGEVESPTSVQDQGS